jgi:cobalamin biosynthesis protein CobT
MLTKSIEVMKYVRASAGRAGLSVVFEHTNQPRHDGKTIYLPRITGETTDLELKELMASTDHEVAHDRFSSFKVLKDKKVDPKGIVLFIWNFLEDSRINKIESLEYQGFRENWDECSSLLIQKILSKSSKETTPIAKITTALICWDAVISASSFPKIELVTNKIKPNKKIIDVLNNFSDRLVHCHSILDKEIGTESTYQLALDILKKLAKECSEEFKENMDVSPGSKSKEVEEGSKSDSDKDGDEESPSKETTGDKSSKEIEEEYKILDIKLTDEQIESYSVSLPEDDREMGKIGVNFAPVSTKGYDWDMTDYDKFIVVNYPKRIGDEKYFTKQRVFLAEYKNRIEHKLVSQENFAQQVRRLIQIRAKSQTQYGVKKGKLDQSRLSRICFKAPGFNERVFKNKIENKILDAAISVLVDMSGSMNGDKCFYALASSLLINEVCSTLNIPVEIVGFSDGHSGGSVSPSMFIYKSFSDLRVSEDSFKEYFSCSSNFMLGNPDGENILWAHDRLIKRKEKKKLLIVMSDGSPAASKGMNGLEKFTSRVIKEIEESKKVDIYGLGLCSSSVTEFYKHHSVVRRPEEIPSNLIELIERKIINV